MQVVSLQVTVYSDDAVIRRQVIDVLGRRPHPGLSQVEYTEIATVAALFAGLGGKGADLVVLDGDATPVGGLGIARQLKDELAVCPPILLLVGRSADHWLAKWSRADAVVQRPFDAIAISSAVVQTLLRRAPSPATP
jgi:DNA-binding response OmpR family regulator